MRFSSKLVIIIIGLGVFILSLLSTVHYLLSYQALTQEAKINALHAATIRAEHLTSIFKHRAAVIETLGYSTEVINAAKASNGQFESMADDQRNKTIIELNNRWKASTDISDPFIRGYLDNPLAKTLQRHQQQNPDLYGEVFITNRYGALIASTNKLSTLAHGYKYWWLAAHKNQKVFFDDRGFDDSVRGYVIGIVQPVYDNGQFVAMIKANLLLDQILEDIVSWNTDIYPVKLEVIRSKGLIVYNKENPPLSTGVTADISAIATQLKEQGKYFVTSDANTIHALAPIPFTQEKHLGGIRESDDHSKGNQGESWLIHATIGINSLLPSIYNGLYSMAALSFVTLLLIAAISRYLGRQMELREQELNHHRNHLEEMINEKTLELKHATEVAESANEAKSQFLSKMSHDFRTPMQAILGFSKMGIKLSDSSDNIKLKNYFTNITHSCNRLLFLLNKLLDYAKLEEGRMEYTFQKNNMLELINNSKNELQTLLEDKSLHLDINNHSTDSTICCDQYTIMRLLTNLLSNAIKFSPQNGTISIDLKSQTMATGHGNDEIKALLIQIIDQGPGIVDTEKDYIFEKFTQSKKLKLKPGGTGLGLAICQEITRVHKGKIWAENSATGGAIFSCLLPCENSASPATD